MIWLTFFLSATVIVLAAIKLAEYGDAIGYRTGLGKYVHRYPAGGLDDLAARTPDGHQLHPAGRR